jgi:hypothetical protein
MSFQAEFKDELRRNLITGIAYCCARAASGHAAAAPPSSDKNWRRLTCVFIDRLVGECEQPIRHMEAKRFGGLEVDDHLKFGGLHDRQAGRGYTVQNPGPCR